MLRRTRTLSVTDFAERTAVELLRATDPEQMRAILERSCQAINEQQHWTLYDHRDYWRLLQNFLDVPTDHEVVRRMQQHLRNLFGKIDTMEYRSWCRQLIDGFR